ncbi:F-box protein, putative, partial [Rhizoctonia solani AG-3 Rhs1AP]
MPDTGGCVLGDLSPELVIKILHYCDYSAIFKFAATCKAYQKIVADTTSLQLHIELEANGLEIVKGSFKGEATYSIILEDLRRFRDAWLNLDVNAIQFIPLDSESPDPPPLMFDFKFNEFTVDPEQGLIAMICRADDFDLGNTCDIHLCSSATGLAHPLAQYPKLTVAFDYPLPPFSSQFALEIMGHRLLTKAAHSGANNYELLIWDWRHGALLHRISSREGMCDFTFLDQRHLVVLSVTRSNPDRAILNKFALMIYAITWDASLQIAANTAHGISSHTRERAIPSVRSYSRPHHIRKFGCILVSSR